MKGLEQADPSEARYFLVHERAGLHRDAGFSN